MASIMKQFCFFTASGFTENHEEQLKTEEDALSSSTPVKLSCKILLSKIWLTCWIVGHHNGSIADANEALARDHMTFTAP